MEWITDSQVWIGLVTLTVLEIILGIDNIVVISILSGKLPLHEQKRARSIGIAMALVTRVLFLLSIVWLASLTQPLFSVMTHSISVRDCILIAGGLFLLVKGTREIHGTIEAKEEEQTAKTYSTVAAVVFQIILFDIVFSLDSVITAIGMAQHLGVMVAAVMIALLLMLAAAGAISSFIHRHPSVKILALSFLLMIGVTLVAEGLEFHVPKGYIYFGMGFSGLIEALNLAAGHRKSLATRRD
ncbi:MAG: TerC family protein [Alphaproteobacteria bacterium]|uniref:TerC family protein n=1 Tax=Candidatus Nitrobium versatile TaxID=2884831 RepID=A0A953J8I2_9BACT|nr:TerC family protein [Candidatus Nitrobium versatile]